MAYCMDVWRFDKSIEYEFKYLGNFGAKGEKRAERVKPTPEQIKKQNQKNKEKTMRRLIKANFGENDIWCTLKYPAGTKKSPIEVKKDIMTFLRKARQKYKKHGEQLKFIYRIEIGKRGGVHVHMIVNRIPDADKIIQECWPHGRVYHELLYDKGGYKDLAAYIVKPAEDDSGQLSMFEEEEKRALVSYSTSRNLIRPQPERKEYTRRTMKKLLTEGIRPSPGYYIDRDSIEQGVNPYTGYAYLHYTEVRIDGG